jgi:hypothetical protein
LQARPHWRSASDLTAVPFANGAGVPQMGKNDPISGIMAGSPLPQNGVKNFSRKRIDGIRRELGLSGRQKRRYRHSARGIPDLYKAESKLAPTGKSFPLGGRFF